MKAHHFGIVFTVFAFVAFLILNMKIHINGVVFEERNKMDRCLSKAVEDGMQVFATSDTKRQFIGSKDDVTNSFFESLYASLEISSDPVAQQKLRLYLPVIVVTLYDGFYVLYHDQYKVTGMDTVAMRWSERYPFSYEDDLFIYRFTMEDEIALYDKKEILKNVSGQSFAMMDFHEFQTSDTLEEFRKEYPDHFLLDHETFYLLRKNVIIDKINERMCYYVNHQNFVAAQSGLTYQFSLPMIDESELIRSIEHPGMIVFFQGYPIRFTKETYQRVIISGAQIYKKEVFYLEGRGWYRLYHKSSCRECEWNQEIDQSMVYHSARDCVEMGAYACEKCCPEGVHVPSYTRLH